VSVIIKGANNKAYLLKWFKCHCPLISGKLFYVVINVGYIYIYMCVCVYIYIYIYRAFHVMEEYHNVTLIILCCLPFLVKHNWVRLILFCSIVKCCISAMSSIENNFAALPWYFTHMCVLKCPWFFAWKSSKYRRDSDMKFIQS
jgi:hypothetical protein